MKDEILKKLLDYMQRTENFALEELPDIARQALHYEMVSAYVNLGLMILLISICCMVGIYVYKHPSDKTFFESLLTVFGSVGSLFGLIASICQTTCLIQRIIKIHLAPKYFLIDLIKGMLD